MLCLHCHPRFIATVAASLLFAAPPALTEDADSAHVVEAIWRVQNLLLQYDSVRTQYACDSLKRKIHAILQAVGAHESTVVEASCFNHDLLRSASIRITLATPVQASEANILAATTFDGRDRLLARLRKTELPTAEGIPRFPATWQRVSLSGRRSLHLDVGDCDLLRGMSQQIFPQLAIQPLTDRLYCSVSATRIRPRFEVQALIALPPSAMARTD